MTGAALAVMCGLILWEKPVGKPWVNASYDYLFGFGARTATNQLVLIVMDNDAYDYFHLDRMQPWDRKLHAELLNKLTGDGCRLVVFDVFFRKAGDPVADQALAEAIRAHGRVVLMTETAVLEYPDLEGVRPLRPAEPFLSAAGTNWGNSLLEPDLSR